jgi:FkbM family methyltransferase
MSLQAPLEKISAFLKASKALGRLNWTGIPFLPKQAHPCIPYNRQNYNTFISWIQLLGFSKFECVVDVGANHGDFSLATCAYSPSAKVVLFEPLPSLQGELEMRARKFPGWRIDARALGEADAEMELQLVEGQDDIGTLAGFSRSYMEATSVQQGKIHPISCKVTTFDKAMIEHKIDRINLLKVDVEGFELEVLVGAANSLNFIESIIIEVSCIRKVGRSFGSVVEVLKTLDQYQFRVIQMFPSLFSKDNPWLPLEYNILLRKDTI